MYSECCTAEQKNNFFLSEMSYMPTAVVSGVRSAHTISVLDFQLSPCTEYSKFPLG